MSILYIKNYKGFRKAYIPLEAVNFFVGENSTGKSSIVQLISILQERSFWSQSLFRTITPSGEKIDLGKFGQIKHKRSEDKFFSIGLMAGHYSAEPNQINALLATFFEMDGEPVLGKLKFMRNGETLFLDINTVQSGEGDVKRYCYGLKPVNIDTLRNEKIGLQEYFANWIEDELGPHLTTQEVFSKSNLRSIEDFVTVLVGQSLRIFQFPLLFRDLIPEPPIRTEPKEKYQKLIDEALTPLEQLLKNEATHQQIVDFGSKAGLFDDLKFQTLSKNEFAIKVYYGGMDFYLNCVGYGISQILPILTNLLFRKNVGFTIQQPEIHLHPKAQAEFGAYLFRSVVDNQNQFIIETHSDYMIDRFRYHIKKNKPDFRSQVIFFIQENGDNHAGVIGINESGNYEDGEALEKFREFFVMEDLRNLSL